MITVGICGACGRMGQTILRVLLERGHRLGAAFEADSCPKMGEDAGFAAGAGSTSVMISPINTYDAGRVDGIIDFSLPDASGKMLETAREAGKPIVIGTTGLTGDDKKKIDLASKDIPVLFSPNMSLGVNLLFKLTEITAGILKEGYDIEIFEAHHRFKKDSPSGTAKRLLEVVRNAAPEHKNARDVHDRSRVTEMRGDDEIGMTSMRGGDIVGEHTVYFAGMGERLELTHRASSRENFARGAVLAMEFLVEQEKGLYNMFDVLRL